MQHAYVRASIDAHTRGQHSDGRCWYCCTLSSLRSTAVRSSRRVTGCQNHPSRFFRRFSWRSQKQERDSLHRAEERDNRFFFPVLQGLLGSTEASKSGTSDLPASKIGGLDDLLQRCGPLPLIVGCCPRGAAPLLDLRSSRKGKTKAQHAIKYNFGRKYNTHLIYNLKIKR